MFKQGKFQKGLRYWFDRGCFFSFPAFEIRRLSGGGWVKESSSGRVFYGQFAHVEIIDGIKWFIRMRIVMSANIIRISLN
jgi:hypothetical protein